jgi:hypothetical protein
MPALQHGFGIGEEKVGNPRFWGSKQLLCGICVLFDCQDVLFETETAFFTAGLEIGSKNLPNYMLFQPLAAVSRATESFYFL